MTDVTVRPAGRQESPFTPDASLIARPADAAAPVAPRRPLADRPMPAPPGSRTAPAPGTGPAAWDVALGSMQAEHQRTYDTAMVVAGWAGALTSTFAAAPTLRPAHLASAAAVLALLVLAVPTLAVGLAAVGLYDARRERQLGWQVGVALLASGGATLAILLVPMLVGLLTPAAAVAGWLVGGSAMVAMRVGSHARRRADAATPRRVLVVGTGPRARRLVQHLAASPTPLHVIGCVDTPDRLNLADAPAPIVASVGDLEDLLMHTLVDEVLVALPVRSRHAEMQTVIDVCARAGVPCKHLADVFAFDRARPRLEEEGPLALVSLPVACEDHRLVVKRALDIVGALVALVLLAPVLLTIAVAIRLTSPGPVIFAQTRFGYRKRHFRMYKFRTMVCDAEDRLATLEEQNEADGAAFKLREDPRVTALGRRLRRTSLDELPQLWNVLRGEMSLVGPRPMSVRDVARFTEPWLMRRFSVRPGLTCLWQIGGRCTLPFEDWMRLDLLYIDRWSLSLDAWILLRTVPAVVRGVGAL